MAVVMHHCYMKTAIHHSLTLLLPACGARALRGLAAGVQVFFVVSGFVIAHSLRDTPVTPRHCARFILRRQLRLNPPYWTMLLVASLIGAATTLPAVRAIYGIPAVSTMLCNVLYLQRIVGRQDILDVGWTLTLEIQFYLAFVLLLAIGTRRGRTNSAGPSKPTLALLMATGLAALAANPNITFEARWGVHAWPFFVAGVLCYWAVQRQIRSSLLAILLVATAASELHFGLRPAVAAGIATTALLWIAGRANRLTTWGSGRPMQFLGRISYSLYLVHMPVIVVLLAVLQPIDTARPALAMLWLAVAVAAAIGVAAVFHRLVEEPSLWLASQFNGRRRDNSPHLAPAAAPPAPADLQTMPAVA